MLDFARRHCAHYAKLLPPIEQPLGSDAGSLLRSMPLLSRAEVQRSRAQLMAAQQDSRHWRVAHTTGTTGEPLAVIVDQTAQATELEVLEAHIDRCVGRGEFRRSGLTYVTLHAAARSRAAPSPLGSGSRMVKWNLTRAWQLPDAAFVRCLVHLSQTVVTAMPSVMSLLCNRIIASGVPAPRPLIVVLSGEQVEPQLSQTVADVLDCPATSAYVLTEAGIVATACPEGGYHIEEKSAYVEILDGQIVVTTLANFAMPLLRYRTGDQGEWISTPCGCGRQAPRLRVIGGRTPRWLDTESGGAVNTIQFAKVLSQLDVDRVSIRQLAIGEVEVSYRAVKPLDTASRSVLEAALKNALGPASRVDVREVRTTPFGTRWQAAHATSESHASAPAGPAGADLSNTVRWLLEALRLEEGIEAAAITGSALDPASMTRYSDVDLVVFVHHDRFDPRWLALARRLRSATPALSVHIDELRGMGERAPLFACRLLCECLPVLGQEALERLIWPKAKALGFEARFWCQDAATAVRNRITAPLDESSEPVYEAWFAAKIAIHALRYRYLLQGVRATAWAAILEHAAVEPEPIRAKLVALVEATEVAREYRPPPIREDCAPARYLEAALVCIRLAAEDARLTAASRRWRR